MTVWILHQELTASAENRDFVVLPFDGTPDLSHITNPGEFKRILQTLHPDDPPEAITRRMDRIWQLFTTLEPEDIIAVPQGAEVALGQISGRYHYSVGEGGRDVHTMPIAWLKRVPLSAFSKYKAAFSAGKITEVTDVELRNKIRSYLPYSYNRFARWKWILAVFFALGLLRMLTQMFGK